MLSLPIAERPSGDPDFSTHAVSQARVSALRVEHDDLDCAIDALAADSTHDDLTVTRLKKRRLQIRDEIAALVAAVPPREADAVPAAPKSSDGSILLGVLLILLVPMTLELGWSDLSDSLNTTAAQIFLLSLMVADHA